MSQGQSRTCLPLLYEGGEGGGGGGAGGDEEGCHRDRAGHAHISCMKEKEEEEEG